jgi:hypothetical protein
MYTIDLYVRKELLAKHKLESNFIKIEIENSWNCFGCDFYDKFDEKCTLFDVKVPLGRCCGCIVSEGEARSRIKLLNRG